jgi:NAD+ kinase
VRVFVVAIKRIAIVAHLGKDIVLDLANKVIEVLRKKQVDILIEKEDARILERPDLAVEKDELQRCDLIIALGGDGTILRAVRLLNGAEVLVLGINLGKLGFLSEVERDQVDYALEQVLAGNYWVDRRMMLEWLVKYNGGSQSGLALNEIVIERGYQQKMLPFTVRIDRETVATYLADGLIVATPTGSTAYSFSAGGPIVAPDQDLIITTPICPHSLFGRSFVVPGTSRLVVEVPRGVEITIGADGLIVLQKSNMKEMVIKRSESEALLVRLTKKSFFSLLRQKLKVWDQTGR